MKKLLLIFLFIASSFFSYSQTWINPGATWVYSWWVSGEIGTDVIEYTHDTVITGHTCQVLRTTRKEYMYASGPGWVGAPYLAYTRIGYNYTYNNGDTVFYIPQSAIGGGAPGFHILYNFGATAGDTWDLGVDTSVIGCSHSIEFFDSASTVMIGTAAHRAVYVHYQPSSSALLGDETHETEIIENYGCLYYPFPQYHQMYGGGVIEVPLYTFKCFYDGFNDYSVVSADECANPLHLGIPELADPNSFTLYPNPAEDMITVTVKNSYGLKVTIYNALGEMVFSEIPKDAAFNVDISRFDSGIYLMSIEDKNGLKQVKRFVKN